MHFSKKKKKYGGKKKFIMMKLNIYNAYDKIERSFIEKMLFALVSSKKWTKLIAEYITTFAFSAKINLTLLAKLGWRLVPNPDIV